jgi:microcystin-dependent protein
VDPFIGEIRTFAFDFAPRDWATCSGQTLAVLQNQALFSLLGATFGGNGTTNFCLPNLNGRAPLGAGQGADLTAYKVGDSCGVPMTQLAPATMPAHRHALSYSSVVATSASPAGAVLSVSQKQGRTNAFEALTPDTNPTSLLAPASVAATGSGAAHENRQPYLPVNYCIALQGLYPTRP